LIATTQLTDYAPAAAPCNCPTLAVLSGISLAHRLSIGLEISFHLHFGCKLFNVYGN